MIKDLVLVGCGHMGRAMLSPWLAKQAARHIWVVEPAKDSLKGLEGKGAGLFAKASDLPPDMAPEAIVFAVRPQELDTILPEYKKFTGALFLSIAAGKKMETYRTHLGQGARIIRAMPNLAARVGEGAIVMVAGGKASGGDRTIAEVLFSPLGKSFWLDDESLMDAVTALSGSGPAYFYLLADEMAKAGAALGLPASLAQELARQTLIGSAAFAKGEAASLETLYKNVAVKGGTTEAALGVLQENEALKKLMEKALKAAAERGRKLAS